MDWLTASDKLLQERVTPCDEILTNLCIIIPNSPCELSIFIGMHYGIQANSLYKKTGSSAKIIILQDYYPDRVATPLPLLNCSVEFFVQS